jgi:L-asparaginase / beta-aspartyl-peptidase
VTSDVVLAVHGGAGGLKAGPLDPDVEEEARAGLRTALEVGAAILDGGVGAVGAVEGAVVALEDAEVFNAGRGAVYTADATQELEAAIMHGPTRNAGAAMMLRHVKNPIRLARLIMERSPHVALSGHGAELFAADHGIELVSSGYFHSERRLRGLFGEDADPAAGHGTVGAVALDEAGELAAATSTGGTTGKAAGRIGDTPTIGAGTWADATVAVSGTGMGEYFMRTVAGHEVAALIAHEGVDVGDAARRVIGDIESLGGTGGLIALDAEGRLAMPQNTQMMSRGYLTRGGEVRVALYADEEPA